MFRKTDDKSYQRWVVRAALMLYAGTVASLIFLAARSWSITIAGL